MVDLYFYSLTSKTMTLRQKLKYAYLSESIEEMLKLTQETHFYDDCMLQSSAFHRIERDLEKGLINYQDIVITKNRITNALYSILDRYEDEFGKLSVDDKNFDIDDFKKNLKNLASNSLSMQIFKEIEERNDISYVKSTLSLLKSELKFGISFDFIQRLEVFIDSIKPKQQ